MPSKTVSLETSAYDRLKAARASGESFSKAVNRILASSRPSYRQLAGFLTASEGTDVKATIRRMRSDEALAEQERIESWRTSRGHRSRH